MVVWLIEWLKYDFVFFVKGDEIKCYICDGDVFNEYVCDLWDQLCVWLKVDFVCFDLVLYWQVVMFGGWFGVWFVESLVLCVLFNEYVEWVVYEMVFDFVDFLMCYICDMVCNWDVCEML